MRIGLNLIATNKYFHFVPKILESIEKFFFINDDVTILIHTNMDTGNIISSRNNINIIKNEIEHEPWPFTTLKRFHYFSNAKIQMCECVLIFYIDVDSIFIGTIESSMLPKDGIFATLHPCLFQGEGTPERNPLSKAFIPIGSNNKYFCGGFFGGFKKEFYEMCEKIKDDIDSDLKNNYIAIWHDESHLNRFLYENPPSLILKPPFAVAENITQASKESKIIFLDKQKIGGHLFFRDNI